MRSNAISLKWKQWFSSLFSLESCFCVVVVRFVEQLSPHFDCVPLICFSSSSFVLCIFQKCLTAFRPVKKITPMHAPYTEKCPTHFCLGRAFNGEHRFAICRIRRFILRNVKLAHYLSDSCVRVCVIHDHESRRIKCNEINLFSCVFLTHITLMKDGKILWPSKLVHHGF